MTSLAAYIANLAGGASQSPLATPAGPSGGTGLFAALLESTGAAPVIQGELAATLDPSGLPIATPEGQTLPVTASGDAALRQALTEGLGLAQDGAEIDAVIIESPVTTDNEKLVTTNSESLLPADTGSFTSAGAPQTGATQTDSLPSTVQPDSEGPATKAVQEIFIRPDQALQTPPQSPQTPQTSPQQTAAPVPGPQTPQPAPETGARQETRRQDSGNAAAIARATGLDNALNRASQTGRENGLETALSRAVQSPSKGEAQQNGLVQADDSASAKRAPASDVAKAQDPLSVKPGPARPEFAPSGPKIIQRLVKPGYGQTFILFQERAGGEITGASSTPTLTVSVPAQVASPGPASANAPHVPVSTLAVHIAQQANNGARRFDIRLDPPELGRIEVRLEVSREGQVMTHLVVERSETLDLLQRDARQLERALQNAGLNTSDEGMKFSLKDQGLAQGGEQHGHAEDDSGAFTGDGGDDPGDTPPTPVQYIASTGLDIRI